MADTDRRFRNANDYAFTQGFVGGFPNFHEADHGAGVVYGTLLVRWGAAEWRDIPRAELGGASEADVPELFRRANDWSATRGFIGAIPNCHSANYGAGAVQGCLLLKPGAGEWRDVPRTVLGNPAWNSVGAFMRAANDYALANGFAAGVPTFHQADYGNGIVYGINLLSPSSVEWRDVWADVYGIFERFTYGAGITNDQRFRLQNRHTFAYERIRTCGNLNATEQADLIRAYRKRIAHSVDPDPRNNASAPVNGSSIAVNFTNLFPLGDDEIAQTLIHEMMHSAGYTHPKRRDFDPANPGAPIDTPGDGGQYYGTAPLRAEFCIAGNQSDRAPDGQSGGGAIPGLRLVSVIANPPGADIAGEYAVVGNATALPVELTGWTLRDRAGHTFTFPAFTLAANSDVSIWTKAGPGDARNLYWGRRQAVWNNNGDTATLADTTGRIISQLAF